MRDLQRLASECCHVGNDARVIPVPVRHGVYRLSERHADNKVIANLYGSGHVGCAPGSRANHVRSFERLHVVCEFLGA